MSRNCVWHGVSRSFLETVIEQYLNAVLESWKNKRFTWTRYTRWNFAQTTNNNDNKPPGSVPRFHQSGFCSYFLIIRFQVNFFPLRANSHYYIRALHSRLDIILHVSRVRSCFYREITLSLLFISKCRRPLRVIKNKKRWKFLLSAWIDRAATFVYNVSPSNLVQGFYNKIIFLKIRRTSLRSPNNVGQDRSIDFSHK